MEKRLTQVYHVVEFFATVLLCIVALPAIGIRFMTKSNGGEIFFGAVLFAVGMILWALALL